MPGQALLPTFGEAFLEDHARRIMSDPKIALVELVANSWDAGADQVLITWPDPAPGTLAVEDNGTGMTYEEFAARWLELSYNRRTVQGDEVIFPKDNLTSHRKAFGTNGKGRHSMFCFANQYHVDTWRDGQLNSFLIARSSGTSQSPFAVDHLSATTRRGHGTYLSAELSRNHVPLSDVRDLLGSKFIADPSFRIRVNGEPVDLTDIQHLADLYELPVPGLGTVIVRTIDSQKTGRTSKQHGVAWWVNRRLVGDPSWRGIDEAAYLDARTAEAKRVTFVVEADILENEVEADWSAFKEGPSFQTVQAAVREYVLRRLHDLMRDLHRTRKLAALESSKPILRTLPTSSRLTVGKFIDELQVRIPALGQKELDATVEIVSKLEKTRTGYALLEQLSALQPTDLDQLSSILQTWTLQEVAIVLGELEWRLDLIVKMERLLENPSADELHNIQPLFERGLWVFGPEYDSIAFMSNRSLTTVIKQLLGGLTDRPLSTPRNRPDIVALPDSTIGIYSRDEYDDNSEVSGIAKVLLIELKRGGFAISRREKQQALEYANELRKSGKVQRPTEIKAFVLGTSVDEEAAEPLGEGNTTIVARTYSTILRQAHARTFNLLKKIREARGDEMADPEVDTVLRTPDQLAFPVQ